MQLSKKFLKVPWSQCLPRLISKESWLWWIPWGICDDEVLGSVSSLLASRNVSLSFIGSNGGGFYPALRTHGVPVIVDFPLSSPVTVPLLVTAWTCGASILHSTNIFCTLGWFTGCLLSCIFAINWGHSSITLFVAWQYLHVVVGFWQSLA